ncbi:MAG: hypothetical protein ABIB71_00240 [Candidatus Woesearchaeota archaeon]
MWREELDAEMRDYLEALVNKSSKFRENYSKAKHVGSAQIWVAMSILQKEISDLKMQLKVVEEAVKDISPKKPKDDGIDPAKALKDVLRKA